MAECLACSRKCNDGSQCMLTARARVSVFELEAIRDLMIRYDKIEYVQTLNAVIHRYKRENLRVKNRYLELGSPQAMTPQEKQILAELAEIELENPIEERF